MPRKQPVKYGLSGLNRVLLGGGCASTDLMPSAGTDPVTPASTLTPSATPTIKEAALIDIRITVNDQSFTAQLAANPTARDLIDQLPLTLRFRDFNHVEKIAKLPRPLTMEGGSRRRRPRDQRHRLLRSLGRSGSLLRRCRLLERDRTDRSTQRPGHERSSSANQTGSN